MPATKTVRSITGRQTTAGAAEETVALSLNGAAPAASIAVPAGTSLVITDSALSGVGASVWRIQQANDGVTWFDIARAEVPVETAAPTPHIKYFPGLVINGGALVAIRLRVTTAGGATPVIATLRGYSESA